MAYPQQLERFITGYMESQGALCERPSYGIVEVLSEGLTQDTAGSHHAILSFDYEAGQEREGAEFVSHGSPLYERIAQMALRKHVYAERFITPSTKPPDNLCAKLSGKLNCPAQQVEITSTKLYLARCHRFTIKTAYLSEQREEEIIRIWIDAFSAQEIGYGRLPHIFYDDSPPALLPELPSHPLIKLFESALDRLSNLTSVRRAEMEERSRRLMLEDSARTEQYFRTLIEETKVKAAKTSDPQSATDTQSKLDSIEAQKQHHLHDISARYKIGCEVELLDIVCYVIPRWRVRFNQVRRNSTKSESAPGIAWWDEVLRQFV